MKKLTLGLMPLRLAALLLVSLLALIGCTSITDMKADISESMFGREAADPPSELAEFKATTQPRIVWKAQLGKSGDYQFIPAADTGAVYAASGAGEIVKINAISGAQIWRVNVGEKLSGGVGIGPNLVLVGTPKGYVIAYDQSGKLRWKSRVSSEVLSAPKVADNVVVIRAGDSRIFGLDAADGKRKWIYERATPALTLRSAAGVVLDNSAAYAGFAGGKLIALRIADGKVIWEVSVAQPKGATEIERIADITSLPVVDDTLVYAVAFQGKIAAVDRASGHVSWNRDISSYTGMNAEDGRIYLSHAGGAVYALDYASGKTFWRQGDLKFRNLSAPVPIDHYVAVGDVEGYVHFLDKDDGSFGARIQIEKSPIMPQMLGIGTNGLIAQTRDGGLFAISLK